jgi:hypothetical protein
VETVIKPEMYEQKAEELCVRTNTAEKSTGDAWVGLAWFVGKTLTTDDRIDHSKNAVGDAALIQRGQTTCKKTEKKGIKKQRKGSGGGQATLWIIFAFHFHSSPFQSLPSINYIL